jgi:hypothetical protein
VDWIHLTQNRNSWRAVMNTAKNLRLCSLKLVICMFSFISATHFSLNFFQQMPISCRRIDTEGERKIIYIIL